MPIYVDATLKKGNKKIVKNYRLLSDAMFVVSQRIIYFFQINLDSEQEVLALINKLLVLLIWESKFVRCPLIALKVLIKFGMMD